MPHAWSLRVIVGLVMGHQLMQGYWGGNILDPSWNSEVDAKMVHGQVRMARKDKKRSNGGGVKKYHLCSPNWFLELIGLAYWRDPIR